MKHITTIPWNEMNRKYAKKNLIKEDQNIKSGMTIWNSMNKKYAKKRLLKEAKNLKSDVISWNAMIMRYTQNGPNEEGLIIFEKITTPNLTFEDPHKMTLKDI